MLTVYSHTQNRKYWISNLNLIATRWALLQLVNKNKMLLCYSCFWVFGLTITNSRCHSPLIMGNTVHYNIMGSTVNGCGIGPDSTVLANYSQKTNQRTPYQTMVAQACHETNPNEVPIPQIIVQTGDTPENIIRMALVTPLSFNKRSPLAKDLHALSILLYRGNGRLVNLVFFLFNVFQH